jgi:hypothetical protein
MTGNYNCELIYKFSYYKKQIPPLPPQVNRGMIAKFELDLYVLWK